MLAAAARLAGVVRRTPVLDADALGDRTGRRLLCKGEHMQHTGAFKFRGASNAVALLPPDVRGVATHSSGNHGAALAAAAARRGLDAHVVVPEGAVRVKVEAVRRLGATVHVCAPCQEAREAGLASLAAEGWIPIPPYDHPHIIAGQGTAALELLEEHPDLDALVVPAGGGGLLAGTLLAVAATGRRIPVFGAEPAGADDIWRSLAAGRRVEEHHPDTIADGLRGLVGALNFAVIQEHAPTILRVTDAEILDAMRILWSHLKQVIEPSAAVALAAVRKHPEAFRDRSVGLVLTGGNVDLEDHCPF